MSRTGFEFLLEAIFGEKTDPKKEPIDTQNRAKHVCLPSPLNSLLSNAVPDNKRCYVAGWGRIAEAGTTSTILQELSVPIISHNTCNGINAYDGFLNGVKREMLCAGYMQDRFQKRMI